MKHLAPLFAISALLAMHPAQATTINLSSLDSLASSVTRISGVLTLADAYSGEFSRVDWAGTGSSTYVGRYTPDGSAATFSTLDALTLEFDYRIAGANSSIGIWFLDSANDTNNVLVLFNVDASGSNDQFRVFADGTPATGAAGDNNLGGGPGAYSANQSISTGVNAGAPDWSHCSVTLGAPGSDPLDATRRLITLTTGTTTYTFSIAGTHVNWSNTGIALRLADLTAAGGQGIDIRLTPAPVPEPATTAILGALAALLATLATRRIRNHK
jgi:hypothetical protein